MCAAHSTPHVHASPEVHQRLIQRLRPTHTPAAPIHNAPNRLHLQSESQSTAEDRSSASRSAHVISPSTSTSSVLELGPALLLVAACAANLLCPGYFAARNAASRALSAALVSSLLRPRPGPPRLPPRPPRPLPPTELRPPRPPADGGGGGSEKKRKPSSRSWSMVALRLPLPRQQLRFPPPRWDVIAFMDCSGFGSLQKAHQKTRLWPKVSWGGRRGRRGAYSGEDPEGSWAPPQP